MKRIALLLALAACEKSNDLGKLQDEANTVVAHGRAEVDAYVRRTNELLEIGKCVPASTPGIQIAGEVRVEATRKIEELQKALGAAPAEIDRTVKSGVPDNVQAVIDNLDKILEANGRVIVADFTTVENWLYQHPDHPAPPCDDKKG